MVSDINHDFAAAPNDSKEASEKLIQLAARNLLIMKIVMLLMVTIMAQARMKNQFF